MQSYIRDLNERQCVKPMISCSLTNVKDEKVLDALLNHLSKQYEVKARYIRPRFVGSYEVTLDGKNERAFELDLASFASQVGWRVEH